MPRGMRLCVFYLRGHEDCSVVFADVSRMPKTPPFGITRLSVAEGDRSPVGLGRDILHRSYDAEMFARDELAVVVL